MSFGIAVFPYLKTTGPIVIGPYQFRATDDVADLPPEQALAVREIADMLYVRDDFRVASASYAIVPPINVNVPGKDLDRLLTMHAVVTYAYSQPHDVFDSLLLKPEDCTLHVLSPANVAATLVRPPHHTVATSPQDDRPEPDRFGFVSGYQGLFDLRRPFWAERGSRIYPSVPHVTLNISQDLAANLDRWSQPSYRPSPLDLLHAPDDPASSRVFTAINWYNFANEQNAGPDRALLNLAVAFEALLMLPEDAKSERFVDAVSLLLGRTPRLDVWARQFYKARSRVAHEGQARDLHFYHHDLAGKPGKLDGRAAPLMFYGRQIFQLCVSTIIAGSELARFGDLREKLVSNSERLTEICKALGRSGSSPTDQFSAIAPHIAGLRRYQFLQGHPIATELKLGAVRAAAAMLIGDAANVPPTLHGFITSCAAPANGQSTLDQLDAVQLLHDLMKISDRSDWTPELHLLAQLVDYVWTASFMEYFSLQRAEKAESAATVPSADPAGS